MTTPAIIQEFTKGSPENSSSFEKSFGLILKEISTILDDKCRSSLHEWITFVVDYNVPHGKQIRGKMVEMAYKVLSKDTDQRRIEDAQILGWCVEILQASFLIADDVMNNGKTRRGRPCWYKVNQLGLNALNDAFILEHLVYQIIKQRFGNSKLGVNLLDILLNVTFNTVLGQSLDTRCSVKCNWTNENQSTTQLYQSISTLKTGYYTIYLPIALTMALSGYQRLDDSSENDLWKQFEDIALKIGMFFQIQDDYFDCFADENKMGKMGSDIEEGKCSWLYVKAMELCSSNIHQLKILKDNYGRSQPINISRIKELYKELGLPVEYLKAQQEMNCDIMNSIMEVGDTSLQQVLKNAFNIIFKRAC